MVKQQSILALILAAGLAHVSCSDKDTPDSGTSRDPSRDDGDDGDDEGADAGADGARDGGSRDSTTREPDDADEDVDEDDRGGELDASQGNNGEDDASKPDEPAPVACDASKAPVVPGLALETVVSGLSGLTFAAQPPDSSDWYLLQQSGQIRVFKDGALLPEPFLDLSSEIPRLMTGLIQDERGLLGLAFPHDYASSGKFYVMLTPVSGPDMNRDVVREYTRSEDPYVADPGSKKDLVRLEASAFNHNGGHIAFGPDKMLYVGTGDGGGSCSSDKRGAPQSTDALFGKILRLDPSAEGSDYAASGNPFAADGDPRVLHYGLRNPYRFSFSPTGDLFIGDVGQDAYEELSVAPSGAEGLNFGWPAYEGKAKSSGSQATCASSELGGGAMHTAPIADFDRRSSASGPYRDWRSIIGGHVYRGSALPELRGVYLFGDFVGTRMAAVSHCDGKTSEITTIAKNRDPNEPDAAGFTRPAGEPALGDLTAIVTDNDGELYLVANFDRLYKVVPRD